jgi:hypothetical protein
MAIPPAGKAIETPPPDPPEQIMATGTLLGPFIQTPQYRFPDEVNQQLLNLLQKVGDETIRHQFLVGLESLIGGYQIYKQQDQALSQSASEAMAHLEQLHQQAQKLQQSWNDAWHYKAAHVRLRWAWSMIKAEDHASNPNTYFNPHTGPDTLSRLTENLDELRRLLQWATSPLFDKPTKVGRPANSREVGFLWDFRTLSQEHFPDLSIRRKPLKPVLQIALTEIGWIHADIRPLLNKVEPPATRNKPAA